MELTSEEVGQVALDIIINDLIRVEDASDPPNKEEGHLVIFAENAAEKMGEGLKRAFVIRAKTETEFPG